jgi:antitoxin (DNA-binding transcriptional repressor) of toxin-antitoxin stability system
MKAAKIGQLRDQLSRYLDRVRAGETVVVYERDIPIAEIVPIHRSKRRRAADEARIERLVRKGVLTRGNPRALLRWLKTHKPIRVPGGRSVVEALLEERESGW